MVSRRLIEADKEQKGRRDILINGFGFGRLFFDSFGNLQVEVVRSGYVEQRLQGKVIFLQEKACSRWTDDARNECRENIYGTTKLCPDLGVEHAMQMNTMYKQAQFSICW